MLHVCPLVKNHIALNDEDFRIITAPSNNYQITSAAQPVKLKAVPELISVQPISDDTIHSDELDFRHPLNVRNLQQFLRSVF
jgi:hypothetical protein